MSDALALDGVEDDHGRSAGGAVALGLLHGGGDLLDVVAVLHVDHVPAEGGPLVAQRRDVVDLRNGVVDLQLVVVGKADEVGKALGGGEHGRLPDLAFLRLAVADERVDRRAVVLKLRAERNAHGAGEALAERAGGHVDAGGEVHVAVAGQMRAALVEGEQLGLGEVAAVGERGVHRGAGVALRADKAVASRHFRLGRVDVHFFKVQHGEQLDDGEAAADVADAQMPDAGHDITADILANGFQMGVQW